MYLAIRKDRQPMTTHKIFIYGPSYNTLSNHALADSQVFHVSKFTLKFAITFEPENGFPFLETKTE